MYIRAIFVILALFCTTVAFGDDAADKAAYPNLVSQPDISRFRDLVKEAGLWDFFQAPGPFTLFAPSNDAIQKMDQNKLKELQQPDHTDQLIDFVNYHVVMGKYPSSTLKSKPYRTVNGKNIDVVIENGKITVNGARVIKADIEGPNGVGYVLDQVLMP